MAVETYKPKIAGLEGALVGDENQPEPRKVEPEVVHEEVPAQVAPPRGPEVDTAVVQLTSVRLDEPVLDPSSPEAVQIPDAGRGSLDLPIHRLSEPTVEEVFSEKASSQSEVSDEDRAQAQSEGRSVGQAE